MKTVSKFLGVPVQYYVQVDFDTFVRDDPRDRRHRCLHRSGVPAEAAGRREGRDQDHVLWDAAPELAPAALAYARCRSASQGCDDGDVGRAHRQQQVILAIRDQVLDPKRFPELMANGSGDIRHAASRNQDQYPV